MTDVRAAADDLLRERPELEDDLETLLEIDADGQWTFDDIPLDSGTFGEVAATDIVESVDDAYRIQDRAAVQAAIEADPEERNQTDDQASVSSIRDGERSESTIDLSVLQQVGPTVQTYITMAGTGRIILAGLLLFVFVMRAAVAWDAVFRDGHIALLGNDPYYYRFWVEELFRSPEPLTEIASFGEPLMLATLWAASLLLGGTAKAAGLALAWYPVVAALIVGGLLYWIGTLAFDDRRVGYAAVAFYAITPILTYRSGLGFGDHHAFDYLMMTLTVFGVVALATDNSEWQAVTRRRIAGSIAIVGGTAGAVHGWSAGPLLVAPIALYSFFAPYFDLQAERDPLRANAWLLGGLGISAVIAATIYIGLGWSPLFNSVMPALLLGVSTAFVILNKIIERYSIRPNTALTVEAVGGILVFAAMWMAIPILREFVIRGLEIVTYTSSTGIVETTGLFSKITTPIAYLGIPVFMSIPGLGWISYAQIRNPDQGKLGLVIFAWSLFVAAIVQLRFAAIFGVLSAIFTGVVFVYLLVRLGLVDASKQQPSQQQETNSVSKISVSIPTPGVMVLILLLFLLIGGIGMWASVLQTNDTTVTDSEFQAAMAIDDHATATNTTYPDNYVFSTWGENRIYNYFVSGQSKSYNFAQSHYKEFVSKVSPDEAYNIISDRVGYIVIKPLDTTSGGRVPPELMQARLNQQWGSATRQVSGLGHYRAIYSGLDRKVYQVVPGAKLQWTGNANTTQAIETAARVDGRVVPYKRRVTSNQNGQYSVRVAYPGEYEFSGLNTTVSVSEAAVTNGTTVAVSPAR
jgi:dolichyl-diphosphooligosaccharide--protein glycosyltransferase